MIYATHLSPNTILVHLVTSTEQCFIRSSYTATTNHPDDALFVSTGKANAGSQDWVEDEIRESFGTAFATELVEIGHHENTSKEEAILFLKRYWDTSDKSLTPDIREHMVIGLQNAIAEKLKRLNFGSFANTVFNADMADCLKTLSNVNSSLHDVYGAYETAMEIVVSELGEL